MTLSLSPRTARQLGQMLRRAKTPGGFDPPESHRTNDALYQPGTWTGFVVVISPTQTEGYQRGFWVDYDQDTLEFIQGGEECWIRQPSGEPIPADGRPLPALRRGPRVVDGEELLAWVVFAVGSGGGGGGVASILRVVANANQPILPGATFSEIDFPLVIIASDTQDVIQPTPSRFQFLRDGKYRISYGLFLGSDGVLSSGNRAIKVFGMGLGPDFRTCNPMGDGQLVGFFNESFSRTGTVQVTQGEEFIGLIVSHEIGDTTISSFGRPERASPTYLEIVREE